MFDRSIEICYWNLISIDIEPGDTDRGRREDENRFALHIFHRDSALGQCQAQFSKAKPVHL